MKMKRVVTVKSVNCLGVILVWTTANLTHGNINTIVVYL